MWLAVDENGDEAIFRFEPIRLEDIYLPRDGDIESYVIVPKGTIERLLNYPLTWDDEAQEITEYK